MAESEAYRKMTDVSTVTDTSLFARIGSWGKISDKDTVWLTYSMTAKDAPSVYRAW
jgi:hypothetical protein